MAMEGKFAAHFLALLVPLLVGLHLAFALSPADEPDLELLLSCPRPLAWAIAERVVVIVFVQGGIALAASLVCLLQPDAEPLALMIAGWLPSAVAVGGVALTLTLWSRHGTLSAMVLGGWLLGTIMVWQEGMVRWPALKTVYLYLQLDHTTDATYLRNRLTLLLLGLLLAALACALSRDEERLLGMRAGRRLPSFSPSRQGVPEP